MKNYLMPVFPSGNTVRSHRDSPNPNPKTGETTLLKEILSNPAALAVAKEVVTGLISIQAIRENGRNEVERIESETVQLRVKLDGMLDLAKEQGSQLRTRAEVATALLGMLPSFGSAERIKAMEALPLILGGMQNQGNGE